MTKAEKESLREDVDYLRAAVRALVDHGCDFVDDIYIDALANALAKQHGLDEDIARMILEEAA